MKNLMQQQKIKNILKEVDAELERLVNVDDAFVRECALNTCLLYTLTLPTNREV